ncbi:hypothetical protein J2X69_001896 [Algoriphagus sp. 4150]|uniref:hypothetical protein n=1 Tax=Algoriphagus sp. 4150 TaxID=2817756 RepID=UPI00285837EE|nr:hypothetical protein [Algoriphagus sp. 4150]MDR7129551.1 hypothetical protein [Algoriphagus sp. 4150]
MLSQQKLQEAFQVFELNTGLYTEGTNTFDSIGEALRLYRKIEERIRSYRRSIALDSENENAKNTIPKAG